MAAHHLPVASANSHLQASSFCVVGAYQDKRAKSKIKKGKHKDRVAHVAFLSPDGRKKKNGDPAEHTHEVDLDTRLRCDHIAVDAEHPPRAAIQLNDELLAHVVGYFGNDPSKHLDADDRKDLNSLIISLSENEGVEYVANPSISLGTEVDPDTGRATNRFSCVGLVVHCIYRITGTMLLEKSDNNPDAPLYTLKELNEVFPNAHLDKKSWNDLSKIGLTKDDQPWPLWMPSHLFHAFRTGKFPFAPQKAHDQF